MTCDSKGRQKFQAALAVKTDMTFVLQNSVNSQTNIKPDSPCTYNQGFFPKKMFRGTLSLTQENPHFIVQI